MISGPARRFFVVAVTALVVGGLTMPAARSADDAAGRKQLLALNDLTGENPIEGEIKILDASPDAKSLLKEAVAIAHEKDQPFNYNAAYVLARVALHLKDYDAVKSFYEICATDAAKLRSGYKLAQAYQLNFARIDALYLDKKYTESTAAGQDLLEGLQKSGISPSLRAEVLRRMVRSITKQGLADKQPQKVEQAKKMLDNLLEIRGEDWRNLELKGWFERETDHLEEAAKTYESLIDAIGRDKNVEQKERPDLIADVHYLLSGLYIDLNQVNKAAEHLETLLKEHPDDPTYNNDLGYIWADHDMHLDKAESMIRKALAEDRKQRHKEGSAEPKDNAAYLDSLGWVLYKEKRYPEAREALEKAVQDKEGQHVEIFDHLGDLYMATGDRDKAIGAWKQGIEHAGPSKREQERKAEVEKKIRQLQEAHLDK